MSSLENDRKRFWTKKIMFESIRSLVSKYNVQVPQVPGFSWTNWFKDQSSTLHELVKRAKRNRRNMDCLQTLPFNPEEPQHVLDLLCDSKVPSLISTFLWSITFCSTNNFRCLIAHVMLGIYLGGPTQRILCSQESIEQCQVEIATQEVPWIKSTGTAHVYFFSTDRWFSNSWLTWLTKQIQNKRNFWQSTRRSPRLQPLLRRRTVGMKMKRIFRNVLRKKQFRQKQRLTSQQVFLMFLQAHWRILGPRMQRCSEPLVFLMGLLQRNSEVINKFVEILDLVIHLVSKSHRQRPWLWANLTPWKIPAKKLMPRTQCDPIIPAFHRLQRFHPINQACLSWFHGFTSDFQVWEIPIYFLLFLYMYI